MSGVEAWFLVGVDASGWDGVGESVVAEADLPAVAWVFGGVAAGFDDAVVVGAGEYEVRECCDAACPPGLEVVCFAGAWGLVAAGEDAALVAFVEGCADGWGDEAVFASDVEDLGGSAEGDGQDVGVAGEAS